MEGTNLHLSQKETEVILNTEWILTKHRITKKIFEMFDNISLELKKEVDKKSYLFPDNIKYQSGKISRGENYRLLPYLILDYPSFFWKNNFLAYRTMFWWGNFFSVTLHLSGDHQKKFIKPTLDTYNFLCEHKYFIATGDDQWQHHFESSNYTPASQYNFSEFENCCKQPFFKIAKFLDLTQWETATEFIITTFKELLMLMEINYQGGKKDL
ncbi:MAG: hypothetical protein ABIR81_03375 [Ginsengibacter sp.]